MSWDPTFYLRHRFFRFFRFTVASDIFWKKHFPVLALGIQPKKPKRKRKNRKNRKKPSLTGRCLGTQHSIWDIVFFRFFRFTVASDIFWKKHFPVLALGIQPKKPKKPKKPSLTGRCLGTQHSIWDIGFFGFFGLRLLRTYFWKNTFHYRPLVFTISLRKLLKRFFPKYFRQFILNFFLWRPDFFKGQ